MSALQVEPSPTLAFSGSQSPHAPLWGGPLHLRCLPGVVMQLSSLPRGELAVQQPHKPPHTCCANSLPQPQEPPRLDQVQGLPPPSTFLEPKATRVCAEGREGVCSTRRKGRQAVGVPCSPGRARGRCS